MDKKRKVVVCISGASGAGLGLKLYTSIPDSYQKYLILSKNAQVVLEHEEGVFWEDEIYAPPASGSFGVDITFVVPTSMNTLAKIATGIEDNLITRVAGVAIKEGKKLILAPREAPFSPIHLENMLKLSRLCNVQIAPPVVNYYIYPTSLEEMEYAIIGRWLDIAGIENDLFRRWGLPQEEWGKRGEPRKGPSRAGKSSNSGKGGDFSKKEREGNLEKGWEGQKGVERGSGEVGLEEIEKGEIEKVGGGEKGGIVEKGEGERGTFPGRLGELIRAKREEKLGREEVKEGETGGENGSKTEREKGNKTLKTEQTSSGEGEESEKKGES
ncbi:MAG: UbiX family flavin prenyltransferase [Campylobacterales bacterium]